MSAAIASWVSRTSCSRSLTASSSRVALRWRHKYTATPSALASSTSDTHVSSSSVGSNTRMSASSRTPAMR